MPLGGLGARQAISEDGYQQLWDPDEPADSFTNQYAEAANAALQAKGMNTTGDGFAPITVELKEAGNERAGTKGERSIPRARALVGCEGDGAVFT